VVFEFNPANQRAAPYQFPRQRQPGPTDLIVRVEVAIEAEIDEAAGPGEDI